MTSANQIGNQFPLFDPMYVAGWLIKAIVVIALLYVVWTCYCAGCWLQLSAGGLV